MAATGTPARRPRATHRAAAAADGSSTTRMSGPTSRSAASPGSPTTCQPACAAASRGRDGSADRHERRAARRARERAAPDQMAEADARSGRDAEQHAKLVQIHHRPFRMQEVPAQRLDDVRDVLVGMRRRERQREHGARHALGHREHARAGGRSARRSRNGGAARGSARSSRCRRRAARRPGRRASSPSRALDEDRVEVPRVHGRRRDRRGARHGQIGKRLVVAAPDRLAGGAVDLRGRPAGAGRSPPAGPSCCT